MAPKYLQILTSFDDLAHTTQQMKFSIKDFFITCDQIRRNCGFSHITEEIFNGKLQFLCCVRFHPDIYSPWVYNLNTLNYYLKETSKATFSEKLLLLILLYFYPVKQGFYIPSLAT